MARVRSLSLDGSRVRVEATVSGATVADAKTGDILVLKLSAVDLASGRSSLVDVTPARFARFLEDCSKKPSATWHLFLDLIGHPRMMPLQKVVAVTITEAEAYSGGKTATGPKREKF